MKHYVNLAFRSDISAADLLVEIEKVLKLAVEQITGFRNYELLKANEWSAANQKMLLVMDFADSESLETYIKHNLHIQLLQTVKPHLADKAIFDGFL